MQPGVIRALVTIADDPSTPEDDRAAAIAALSSLDGRVGHETYQRVLRDGIFDRELDFLRDPRSFRDLAPFHAAFRAARARGVSPTELASSGRYWSDTAYPIRINVWPDGTVSLADGRHRYTAARLAGARAILARVVEYGPRCGHRAERTAVLALR